MRLYLAFNRYLSEHRRAVTRAQARNWPTIGLSACDVITWSDTLTIRLSGRFIGSASSQSLLAESFSPLRFYAVVTFIQKTFGWPFAGSLARSVIVATLAKVIMAGRTLSGFVCELADWLAHLSPETDR